MKKQTISTLKKKLDKVFSEWVRRSHADSNGDVSCFTCGKRTHWKQIQNGHFVSRQYLATRFDPNNCRPQCVGCNVFGGGKPLDFEDYLVEEVGRKKVQALKQSRYQITKVDEEWYLGQIYLYQTKLKEME